MKFAIILIVFFILAAIHVATHAQTMRADGKEGRWQNGDQNDGDGHVCDHRPCLRLWWFYWLYAYALAWMLRFFN